MINGLESLLLAVCEQDLSASDHMKTPNSPQDARSRSGWKSLSFDIYSARQKRHNLGTMGTVMVRDQDSRKRHLPLGSEKFDHWS